MISGTNRYQKARVLLLLVPLVVSVVIVAYSSPRPVVDNAATESAIRQLTLDWVAAEASNNVDSALSFLWDDATMQPPNAPGIQGHAAIRAVYIDDVVPLVGSISIATGAGSASLARDPGAAAPPVGLSPPPSRS